MPKNQTPKQFLRFSSSPKHLGSPLPNPRYLKRRLRWNSRWQRTALGQPPSYSSSLSSDRGGKGWQGSRPTYRSWQRLRHLKHWAHGEKEAILHALRSCHRLDAKYKAQLLICHAIIRNASTPKTKGSVDHVSTCSILSFLSPPLLVALSFFFTTITK